MKNTALLSQIALTLVPHIGAVQARMLINHFGDPEAIFRASKTELSSIGYIGEVRASAIRHFNNFEAAEQQIRFIEKYNITPLFITDPAYPQRLTHCPDAPVLLYFKGNANLNSNKVISIIGTRGNSSYGRHITQQLVTDLAELAENDLLITSGLAMGIDAIAHATALQVGLPTVGVLAHGLDTVYPSQHRHLAKDMLHAGGLLTEYCWNVAPDKYNFPKRNRIVAGMADAIIVIETGTKGGSIITAELACSYNREVFAIPGRITDPGSKGCLSLIADNKAALLSGAKQLFQMMRWPHNQPPEPALTTTLNTLRAEEQFVIDCCRQHEIITLEELYNTCNLSNVSTLLVQMELKGLILSLPGKRYTLPPSLLRHLS
ncbi:DNA-processing protein DprA [Filimonas effusa]|uniref:DNA-protecting protein DprA n=1 Tax=Filimonas effusa TaxID=2508721 RepID=A0A4Q1D5Q3_9BACT|nr:DNA-processing protein DprA [Filimonas effusa]RXK82991.1 DNA-protecting protein DprA [Filimonas effusa]